jgi:hypothetical protein
MLTLVLISGLVMQQTSRQDLKCVKHDLFAKVKFICEPKVDLALGGKICSDCKKKSNDLTGGQSLSRESHDTHMEAVWTDGLTKHMQKNALAQKTSAACTVMQNEFSGETQEHAAASSLTRFIDCH